MLAIIRREFSAYFASPIGYIYLAVFYVFAGFFFFSSALAVGNADLTGVFSSMFTIILLLIPILTMRLMSEDKKLKTDQALLTAPISLFSLVIGKLLGAFAIYTLGLSITLVYGVVMAVFAPVNWVLLIGNYVGILLFGLALISAGMFVSSLTENQLIAAVGGFFAMMFFALIDTLASLIPFKPVADAIYSLSFFQKYSNFTAGILSLDGIVFFLSITAIFVFLTVRIFERKRWA